MIKIQYTKKKLFNSFATSHCFARFRWMLLESRVKNATRKSAIFPCSAVSSFLFIFFFWIFPHNSYIIFLLNWLCGFLVALAIHQSELWWLSFDLYFLVIDFRLIFIVTYKKEQPLHQNALPFLYSVMHTFFLSICSSCIQIVPHLKQNKKRSIKSTNILFSNGYFWCLLTIGFQLNNFTVGKILYSSVE